MEVDGLSGQTHANSFFGNLPYHELSPRSNQVIGKNIHVNGHRATSTNPSTVSDSFDIIGADMKELIEAMTALERLGVEKSEIAVPKVVVIGDQSAGKSSLIEAMSEIQVPRNAGTCTRCPLQITVAPDSEPWRCTVTLVYKYAWYDIEDPYPSDKAQQPFHPWTESDTSTTHFATLTNKDDLKDVLERAQIAILHPSQNPTKYLKGRKPVKTEVEFSPNYISLQIQGPNLPNLSFYDLPGIINQTEHGDKEYLVDIVRNLAKEYISDDSCLVLLACSMESDIHTSSAGSIVHSLKANDRCIGVLTKPDRLPSGDPVDIWRDILSGRKFKRGHGYYVTKQPAQTELALGHTEARTLEDEFFASAEPWCSTFADFKHLFGTKHLQQALSRKLASQIMRFLPDIEQKVEDRLASIEEELATLPKIPEADAYHIVTECLNSFMNEVNKFVKGKFPDYGFRNTWKAEKQAYREAITDLRPRLSVASQHDAKIHLLAKASPSKPKALHNVISLDDDDNSPEPVAATPTKKRKADDGRVATPASTPSRTARRSTTNSHAVTISLDDVKKVLELFSVSGRPGTFDPEAVDHLILKGLQHWGSPTEQLKIHTRVHLVKALKVALDRAFGKHKDTQLFALVQDIVFTFLDQRLVKHQEISEMFLEHEHHQPSTENHDGLEHARLAMLSEIESYRFTHRARKLLMAEATQAGKTITEEEFELKFNKDQKRLKDVLGADPAQREIDVMAEIRGYYNVASMRFVDNICRSMDVEVFEHLKEKLRAVLDREVLFVDGMHVQERCVLLLAEDPEREKRRGELKIEKSNLLEAKTVLGKLQEKFSTDPIRQVDWDQAMC
ncbi:hypothetical protein NA57DRAFT_40341 [Rhizodiscina lignyota]|uniref:P-loop containing nucleoside triphosphate hydrolase protein n=1 Tax=Rhizodiscina lignyota TaxID=1504668 RepID=A0A9P4IDP7_9PEZI|nr:hypothetical protein NA57DRAFT_40341 [Rhizodiscina lignyota]